jgi:hypothetical protein
MHGGCGQPFGNVAIELGDRWIDAIAGMNETGIGAKTAGEIVNRLVALDRRGEPFSTVFLGNTLGELAFIVGLKRDAF